MVFVMMSSKRKQDYKKVLKKVKNMLPRPPQVEKVVADFEARMWRGMLGVFPNIKIQGCYFHWTQAIRRKIGELGLLKSFNHKGNVHTFCKKIMALPFLPQENIPPAFYGLRDLVVDNPPLTQLCNYVERQWITSSFYQPRRWSVFMEEIRTNNDLEGWHRRLNKNAKRGQIQFYLLLELLNKEASFVTIQSRLVSEGKLKRNQRKKYKGLQSKLKKLWKRYNDNTISISNLLSSCSHLAGKV